jgi:hypothetical protein
MKKETHAVITLFQHSAELLDLQKSRKDLDDAIIQLATWIQLNAHELTEDDFLGLTSIGGILYRQVLQPSENWNATLNQKTCHEEI